MQMLDGPRVAPTAGRTECLVVLLHGYGADGNDLISLAQAWSRALPTAAFVAPNAPEPLPGMAIGGRQWFDLTFSDPGELWRGVSRAGPGLDRFLAGELARHALPPERLALVGFSQGTMMALHVGLRRDTPPAAIVGFSGVIAGGEQLAKARGPGPAILLVHGDADEVIPVAALDITREALAASGRSVEWHVRPGLGHGIDEAGLALAGHFLARSICRTPGNPAIRGT